MESKQRKGAIRGNLASGGRASNSSHSDRSTESHSSIEEGTSRNSSTHCIPLTGGSPPIHPIQNQSTIGFDRSVFSGHAAPIINQGNGAINTIHNVTNNQLATHRKGLDLLLKAIAAGAFHNSEERYDPPKCHPSTRVAILRKIRLWVEELEKKHDFMWLHGSAGAGKSAIAQTIAEMCEKLNLLAATFFFSRTASGRGDAKQLVPTLVYQLCQSMPEIRSYVEDVIEKDPVVLSRSVEAQFKGLIIEPMERALAGPFSARLLNRPRLIIIDGLDECAGRDIQSNLLRVLSTYVKALPVRLFFLIASRPEPHIRHAFGSSSMAPMTVPLALDESYLPSEDIEIFLLAKFEEIKETHPLRSFLDPAWPTQSEIRSLVGKASGQFIYASTVIKYVNSSRHRPVERLKVIHGILVPPEKDTPFAALDALYSFIFSCVEDLEATLRVLSLLILPARRDHSELTPEFIEDLLCLQRGDTHIILQDLHSLVDIPPPRTDENTESGEVRILHASLGDFLQDQTRSGRFYLDADCAHADLARCFLRHIPQDTSATEPRSYLTSFQRVSCQLFMHHCPRAKGTVMLLEELSKFDFFTILSFSDGGTAIVGSSGWMRTELPPLFRWFQQQDLQHPQYQLYRRHLQSWDSHILTQLRHYITAPFGREFITCLTIPGVQGLRAFVVSALIGEDYQEMIVYLLLDPIRAGDLHVGSNAYTDLAICFTRPYDGILPADLFNTDSVFALYTLPFILLKASESDILLRQLTTVINSGALDNCPRAQPEALRIVNTAIMTYLSKYKTSNKAKMNLRIMQYLRSKSESVKHTILRVPSRKAREEP